MSKKSNIGFLPSTYSKMIISEVLVADTEITLSALKALRQMDAAFPAFNAKEACPVIGFNLFFLAKDKDTLAILNPGANFTEYTLKLINQAQVGDRLIFDNIRILCASQGSAQRYGAIVFKIIAEN